MKTPSPAAQLRTFMAKYTPEVAADARLVLTWMRARLPGAVELVYDNYNWLVIGFGPSERASEAPFSIVLAPRWVTLCFLYGGRLRDPKKLLKGSGSVVRQIRLESPSDLEKPEIKRLIRAGVRAAAPPFRRGAPFTTVIRSISAKQRPRRPA